MGLEAQVLVQLRAARAMAPSGCALRSAALRYRSPRRRKASRQPDSVRAPGGWGYDESLPDRAPASGCYAHGAAAAVRDAGGCGPHV
jgi:hypothetical protein